MEIVAFPFCIAFNMVRKVTHIEYDISIHAFIGCVVFGYGSHGLKVLLKRKWNSKIDRTLPSEHLRMDECAETTARGILTRCIGSDRIHIEQFKSFTIDSLKGRPLWIGHIALVNLDALYTGSSDMEWFDLADLAVVSQWERDIILSARDWLKEQIKALHIGYKLLPEQFTMLQLMNLFEGILQRKFDRANFNKKIKSLTYIKRLDDRLYKNGNKPSYVYTVDASAFQQGSHWFNTQDSPGKSIL